MNMTYEELEMRLAAWAATQSAIRAIIVIGSRARVMADQWSDLDVLIFTTDQARYASDSGWLASFGTTWLTYMEATSTGDPEWYTLYEGGLKIDAVLMPVEDETRDLESLIQPFDDWDAFRRGAFVLYDRLGTPRTFAPKPPRPHAVPTASEFENVVSGILLAAVTVAKFVARGDYWRAQRWFADDLHPHLLTLIEWHAQSEQAGRDTWYAGRFLEEWADPRVIATLPQVFPTYDRPSLTDALTALLDLTRWLSEETAVAFGFTYGTETLDKIVWLVAEISEI